MTDRDCDSFAGWQGIPRMKFKIYDPGMVVTHEQIAEMMRDASKIASGLKASREAIDQGRGER